MHVYIHSVGCFWNRILNFVWTSIVLKIHCCLYSWLTCVPAYISYTHYKIMYYSMQLHNYYSMCQVPILRRRY